VADAIPGIGVYVVVATLRVPHARARTRSGRRARRRCCSALELSSIESVSVVGFKQAYLDGLHEVATRRRRNEQLLVLFLGSTIGNFDRPAGDEFLRPVRAILHPGDCVLLATDLVKPVPLLLRAYDDANRR
jgi:uncharacterized SAM-dependent methyltransferase